MSRLPPIARLDESLSGWGFFLCVRKEVRTDRGGSEFISVVLQDSTGQIQGRLTDEVGKVRDEFETGEFVRVQGRVGRPHRRLELAIERIRRVVPEQDRVDGFREEDCILSAPRPIEEMWRELQTVADAVGDPWIRRLLALTLETYSDRLRIWPAALTVHHAYRGGLLEHILKLAETGRALAAVYGADGDLVVAGAVLHDIGKLEELQYDGTTTYSRTGNLLGHITIGVMMVRQLVGSIGGFPNELQARIEHLIVSHHGSRDLGSPVEPMTEEALILSSIDELDATLHQFRRHLREDAGEGDFTAYHPRLGRVLLKPSGR